MTDAKVTHEPRTYERHGPNSFFADLARSAHRQDPAAAERLQRHQHEVEVDRRAGDGQPTQEQRDQMAEAGFEFRAASSAYGAGGEFDPPAWMIALYASPGRAGRVVADLIDQSDNLIPLPSGIMSINIPRLTTGSSALTQYDGAVVDDVDLLTTDASSQVVTIAGQQDMSQQLYDLTPAPGMDTIMATDLDRAYNKDLEIQLLTGTGPLSPTPGSQLTGLSTIIAASGFPAANIISGTGVGTGTTSVNTLWPLLGQAFAQVGNNRLLPPEAWLSSIRRLSWIASSLDNSNRPIASPGGMTYHVEGNAPQAGGTKPFGPLVGIPAYLTGGITPGTGAENMYCVRPADFYLWEGPPRFIAAVNPGSGTLQVRVSLHRYVAAVLNRYPSGIGVVQSIPAPTGY